MISPLIALGLFWVILLFIGYLYFKGKIGAPMFTTVMFILLLIMSVVYIRLEFGF